MNKSITTEQEGVLESKTLDSMMDYLFSIAEISISTDDFINKVSHGVTDETAGLCMEEQNNLEEWYYQTYLNL